MWIPADGAPRPYVWADITWLLHRHDVSWAYYVGSGTCLRPGCGALAGPGGHRARPEHAAGVHRPSRSTTSSRTSSRTSTTSTPAAAGTLPKVSWVDAHHEPRGAPAGRHRERTGVGDEGGQRGDARTRTGCTRRSSSRGTIGAGSTITCDRPRWMRTATGSACPALMISPWARRGYIDHQTLSFDAYLKFIEDRFLGGSGSIRGRMAGPTRGPRSVRRRGSSATSTRSSTSSKRRSRR